MVFKPKYPKEMYDFIKESTLTGRKLSNEIKKQFNFTIPRSYLHKLIEHHRFGKKYTHGRCTPSWLLKPLGAERKDKDGYILVRVEGGEKRKHFIEWEKYHEPTKPDECLMFLDGDKTNCDISNLYLMKRKYMGAMNDILKGIKNTELKKLAINAAILKLTARDKEIISQKDSPRHQPKNDRWRVVVDLYRHGKTTAEINEATKRNKSTIRWIIRRYNNGFYDKYLC